MTYIFLTGACGIIGQKLIKLFIDNKTINSNTKLILLDNLSKTYDIYPIKYYLFDENIIYHHCDLTNIFSVKMYLNLYKPKAIIHAADGYYNEDKDTYLFNNYSIFSNIYKEIINFKTTLIYFNGLYDNKNIINLLENEKNLNVSLIKYNIHNIISDSIINDELICGKDDIIYKILYLIRAGNKLYLNNMYKTKKLKFNEIDDLMNNILNNIYLILNFNDNKIYNHNIQLEYIEYSIEELFLKIISKIDISTKIKEILGIEYSESYNIISNKIY